MVITFTYSKDSFCDILLLFFGELLLSVYGHKHTCALRTNRCLCWFLSANVNGLTVCIIEFLCSVFIDSGCKLHDLNKCNSCCENMNTHSVCNQGIIFQISDSNVDKTELSFIKLAIFVFMILFSHFFLNVQSNLSNSNFLLHFF